MYVLKQPVYLPDPRAIAGSLANSLGRSISSPTFLLGFGLGAGAALLASRVLARQVADLVRLDEDDNESGGGFKDEREVLCCLVYSSVVVRVTFPLSLSQSILAGNLAAARRFVL